MNDFSQQPTSPRGAPQPPPPPRGTRKRKALIAVAVTFGALLAIGVVGAVAGGDDEDDGKTADRAATPRTPTPEPSRTPTPDTTPATPATPKPAPEDATPREKPTPEPTRDTTEEAKTAVLPDFVGRQLQAAQDAAQEAGFYNLTSHDVTGENRFQVYDRNWHICSQTPDPGPHAPDSEVHFGVVKNNETCP